MTSVPTASPSFGERYRVERELGRGGMATVYLCMDTKFDRRVAIKLLHQDLAAAVGADRFHREIKIATGLTHPNILPAYDSGEFEHSLFYVMPFVEGESLRSRMDRERQLPVQDAIRITSEIASALQYAHSHGIVHRDIKPENILLESEHAVLADFGIARAVTAAGDVEALTKTGISLGTPGYMSPEQALGEKNIDGRSDQYSLACVAYEMLTGQPPFVASTMQGLVAKHLGEPVALISTVRPSVPDELEDVILRALEKVPADRFQTCGEFAEALANVVATTGTWARRSQQLRTVEGRLRTTRSNRLVAEPISRRRRNITAAAVMGVLLVLGTIVSWQWRGRQLENGIRQSGGAIGSLDPRTIAVLYFEDLSRDRSLALAADGLTEGLIKELAQVRGLKVISSRGVAPYKNSEVARDSIARALQAGSLVVGNIESDGGRVRVTARLIDGMSGAPVDRAASFELPAGQLLAALDSLSQETARLLRSRLGEEVRLLEHRASTSSVDAWTRVQLAEGQRKEAEKLLKADDRLGAARALAQADSNLALAEAADEEWLEPILARGWVAFSRAQLEREAAALPWLEAGMAHAERALQRAPNHPEALAIRGTLRYQRWDLRLDATTVLDVLLQDARRDLEAAVKADPGLARANIALSNLYYYIDDLPGAALAARRAYEEDAYVEQAEQALNRIFWVSIDLESFNEAHRACAEGARRFPALRAFVECQLWLMVTRAVPAEPAKAWQLLQRLDSVTPASRRPYALAQGRILMAGALARAGLVDSARNVLRVNRASITTEVDRNQLLLAREAYVRTLTGDHDLAIDLLKRYVAANPHHEFAEKAGTVWWWRELVKHPRWREVAQPGR